jgi:hypothetical protein
LPADCRRGGRSRVGVDSMVAFPHIPTSSRHGCSYSTGTKAPLKTADFASRPPNRSRGFADTTMHGNDLTAETCRWIFFSQFPTGSRAFATRTGARLSPPAPAMPRRPSVSTPTRAT